MQIMTPFSPAYKNGESGSAAGDSGVLVSVTSDVEKGDEEQERESCGAASNKDSVDESDPLEAIAKLGPNKFFDKEWQDANDAVIHADAILDNVDCESFVSDSTGGSLWELERQNCIDAITSGWKDLCDEEDDEMTQSIANLDGQVLVAINMIVE